MEDRPSYLCSPPGVFKATVGNTPVPLFDMAHIYPHQSPTYLSNCPSSLADWIESAKKSTDDFMANGSTSPFAWVASFFFFANFHFDISSRSCSGFSSGRGRHTSQCCGWRPRSLRTSVHRSFLLRGEKICLFNNNLRVIIFLHFHREESVRKFSAVLFTILSDASACQIRGRLVAF
jgi:hypothetical protein